MKGVNSGARGSWNKWLGNSAGTDYCSMGVQYLANSFEYASKVINEALK
jgi:hypothetical protein